MQSLKEGRLPMAVIWEVDGGIQVKVRVQPRAAKNELTGLWDENTLKVRLTAPPVDGEANAACLRFFAKVFGCSQSSVRLVSGQTSRVKIIEISGVTLSYAHEVLGLKQQ